MKKIYLLTLMAVAAAFLEIGVIGCDETTPPTPVVTEGPGDLVEGEGTTVVTNLTTQQLADEYKKKLDELSGKIDGLVKQAADADAATKAADDKAAAAGAAAKAAEEKAAAAEAKAAELEKQLAASGTPEDPTLKDNVDKARADAKTATDTANKARDEAKGAREKADDAAEQAAGARTLAEGAKEQVDIIQTITLPAFYLAIINVEATANKAKETAEKAEETAEEAKKLTEDQIKAGEKWTINDIYLTVKTAEYKYAGTGSWLRIYFSDTQAGLTDKKHKERYVFDVKTSEVADFTGNKIKGVDDNPYETGDKNKIMASSGFQHLDGNQSSGTFDSVNEIMSDDFPSIFNFFRIETRGGKNDQGWILEGVKLEAKITHQEYDKGEKKWVNTTTPTTIYENPCINRTLNSTSSTIGNAYFSRYTDVAFCTVISTVVGGDYGGTDDDTDVYFSTLDNEKIKHPKINFEWYDKNVPYWMIQGTSTIYNELGWETDDQDDLEQGDIDDYSLYLYDEEGLFKNLGPKKIENFWQIRKETDGDPWEGTILISVFNPGSNQYLTSRLCDSAKLKGHLTDEQYALPGNADFGDLKEGKCPNMFTMDGIEEKFDKTKFDAFKIK